MEIVKVITPQNIEIDYVVASLSKRVKARAIDYGIFLGLYSFTAIAFSSTVLHNNAWGLSIFILVWLALMVFYDIVCEIFFNGQSIGKKMIKIKVISKNGERPTVGQYLMRWFFRIIDFGVSLGSVAVVSVAISDNRQRLGDMVAGTLVIHTDPVTRYKDLTFKEVPIDHQITYPQVALLRDEDLTLIHDVFREFSMTKNSLLIYRLAIKIKDYLNIEYGKEINEYQFLEIIVNDYISYTTGSWVQAQLSNDLG